MISYQSYSLTVHVWQKFDCLYLFVCYDRLSLFQIFFRQFSSYQFTYIFEFGFSFFVLFCTCACEQILVYVHVHSFCLLVATSCIIICVSVFLIFQHIEAAIGTKIKGQLDKAGSGAIYTDTFVARSARIAVVANDFPYCWVLFLVNSITRAECASSALSKKNSILALK